MVMKLNLTSRNSSVVIIIVIVLFQEPSAFPLAAVALAAEPVPLAPLPHSRCCCRCCRCYCRRRQCRRFCSSAVGLPAACVCVRVICASSVHTDVSCLTFGLRLNSLSLTGYPPARPPPSPSAHPPPRPVVHRCLPVTLSASEVELKRRLQSCPPTLPVPHERDLYLPSHPPPPSASTASAYQPAQGAEFAGGRYRREQINAGRINKGLAVTNKKSRGGGVGGRHVCLLNSVCICVHICALVLV